MSSSDTLNLPWKIYFFGKDGKYDKHLVATCKDIPTFRMYNQKIKKHVELELEVRVCDCLDFLIMHFKDGEKVYPK